jgi:hypothetical protein
VAINANQEKMEVAIDAMCPKSEVTINKWVKCILVSADQQTQSLCKELDTQIQKISLDVQVMGRYVNKWTQSLHKELQVTHLNTQA